MGKQQHGHASRDGAIPPRPEERGFPRSLMTQLSRSLLEPYQRYIIQEIKRRKTTLVTLDMSMGKTVCALTAAVDLINTLQVEKVLIVAPKLVAQYTWPDEVVKWKHTRYLTTSVIIGTPKQREAALAKDADVYIINRENLVWLQEQKNRPKFDMLIYDESSRLKSGRKRTKTKKNENGVRTKTRMSEFGALCKIRPECSYVTLLTGTPTPNGLLDLWGQAYILDGGEALGTNQTFYKNRWFKSDYKGWTWEPKPFAQKQIMERLEPVMLALRDEDHREVIRKKYVNRYVELPPKVMEEYKRFERKQVSEEYDVEAVSRGVLANKLLQFANGSMFRTDPDGLEEREVVPIHMQKLDKLQEMLEQVQDEQVLIAYNYSFDRDAILKKYPKAVSVDTHKNWKELWDSKKAGILLAHPAQIGHGLNLQKGGRLLIWYGLTWSLELYQQLNARLPRPGQESKRVLIYHIIARGTVDERVLEALRRKGATQDDVTDAVKKIIKGDAYGQKS